MNYKEDDIWEVASLCYSRCPVDITAYKQRFYARKDYEEIQKLKKGAE